MKQIGGENTPRIGYVLRLFERTTNVISIHIIYYRSCSTFSRLIFLELCKKQERIILLCQHLYLYLFIHAWMYVCTIRLSTLL
jgi:hypothetical protein